jgi:hypothetical protein
MVRHQLLKKLLLREKRMKPRKLWKKLAQPLSLSSKRLLQNDKRRVPQSTWR